MVVGVTFFTIEYKNGSRQLCAQEQVVSQIFDAHRFILKVMGVIRLICHYLEFINDTKNKTLNVYRSLFKRSICVDILFAVLVAAKAISFCVDILHAFRA